MQSDTQEHPMDAVTFAMTLVLGIEYDGRSFYGWQYQPQQATVQGSLYQALLTLWGFNGKHPPPTFLPTHIGAAGRTDRGVHAREQVVHIKLSPSLEEKIGSRDLKDWVKGMNALLPKSIRVLWVRCAAPDFDARKMALSRHYRYYLQCSPTPSAFGKGRVGWTWQTLDIESMRQACATLIGTHDFSAFRASECQANTPIRTLYDISIQPLSERTALFPMAQGTLLMYHFHGNAFLHHMIRNMMGTLIEIGSGRRSVDWMRQVLNSQDRAQAGMTFMPDGLYFWQVDYPDGIWSESPQPQSTYWALPKIANCDVVARI